MKRGISLSGRASEASEAFVLVTLSSSFEGKCQRTLVCFLANAIVFLVKKRTNNFATIFFVDKKELVQNVTIRR